MRIIRFILAIWTAKILMMLCKISGSRGSTLPGKYAHKICPDFLCIIAPKVRQKIIAICGTNGKTTTTNLINDIIKSAGYRCVCNVTGANMINGIATAFTKEATIFGTLNCDFASLEVDEATMPILTQRFMPHIVVVTNLFRDQLDRYGEADSSYKLLDNAFQKAPQSTLILNADDPVTSAFGEKNKACYYGILQNPKMILCEEIRDGGICRKCGSLLEYEYYNYDRLGKYKCSGCELENPQITVGAQDITTINGSLDFDIVSGGTKTHIQTNLAGLYNVYNMLMSMAAVCEAGIDAQIAAQVMRNQKAQPGRMSRFDINGKCVFQMLAKNPTGFNQSFATLLNDNRPKDILISLNDTPADGEDISWLWDVDFESLAKADIGRLVLTGDRRYDIYLRMKYAGCGERCDDDCNKSKLVIADTMTEALGEMLAGERELCYAIINYSGMHPAYVELEKRQKEAAHE